jgi:hypothetical protein
MLVTGQSSVEKDRQTLRHRQDTGGDALMNIDSIIGLLIGLFAGANIGFIIAGLMGVADDGEDVFDK